MALHILAHLAAARDRPTTSEAIAAHFQTNPVVIRRSLAGLREAGIVASAKGHGGGWTVARPPASISLGEIYEALGARGELVAAPDLDQRGCRIEAAVSDALDGFYAEAESLLRRRLGEITLADLASDVDHGHPTSLETGRHADTPSG